MVLFSLRRVSKFWAETSNLFLACFSPSKRKLHMHAFYFSLQSNPRWLRAQTLCSCDLGEPACTSSQRTLAPVNLIHPCSSLCLMCNENKRKACHISVRDKWKYILFAVAFVHPRFFLLHQQPLGAAILWFRSSFKERTKQSRWHLMGRTPREAGATVNKLNLPWLEGNKWDGNELKKKGGKKHRHVVNTRASAANLRPDDESGNQQPPPVERLDYRCADRY